MPPSPRGWRHSGIWDRRGTGGVARDQLRAVVPGGPEPGPLLLVRLAKRPVADRGDRPAPGRQGVSGAAGLANSPFTEWDKTFGDARLCAAIADRITFRCTAADREQAARAQEPMRAAGRPEDVHADPDRLPGRWGHSRRPAGRRRRGTWRLAQVEIDVEGRVQLGGGGPLVRGLRGRARSAMRVFGDWAATERVSAPPHGH